MTRATSRGSPDATTFFEQGRAGLDDEPADRIVTGSQRRWGHGLSGPNWAAQGVGPEPSLGIDVNEVPDCGGASPSTPIPETESNDAETQQAG